MIIREVSEKEKSLYSSLVHHPLQSWEWGKFREAMGRKVIRLGVFDTDSEKAKLVSGYQLFVHPVPKIKQTVLYFPKGPMPDKPMLGALKKVAQKESAIFVKLEPNIGGPYQDKSQSGHQKIKDFLLNHGCLPGRPLFPAWTFCLDLKKSEKELLASMHAKTRYNIRLSQRHGVKVEEDNSDQAFNQHLKLLFETTERQGFYAHSQDYHRKMWPIIRPSSQENQGLTGHLLVAKYKDKPLATWLLFIFNKVLYYPYGGSSREHREVMASYAMMWEAIKFGQKMGCQTFDLWGTPGPEPSEKDPWYGFHRFKQGFNPQLIEFIGTYDLIIDPLRYRFFNLAYGLYWKLLRLKAKLPI